MDIISPKKNPCLPHGRQGYLYEPYKNFFVPDTDPGMMFSHAVTVKFFPFRPSGEGTLYQFIPIKAMLLPSF